MSERDATDQRGSLSRPRIIEASLELMARDGLESLTMRALADELGVKAASLYWHVRDRRQLLELLAGALLVQVPASPIEGPWRVGARETCDGLRQILVAHRDSARLLLDVPEALEQSAAADGLRHLLASAGLPPTQAAEAAAVLLFEVVVHELRRTMPGGSQGALGHPAALTIESPSRAVTVRAGAPMDVLARGSRAGGSSAILVSDRAVVIRRLTGTRPVDVELNPLHPWSIRVNGGAWNVRLLLTGLDIRELEFHGGATHVDCVLPSPRGSVPISVSGGALGISLHRPPGSAASAQVSAGAVQVRLDASSTRLALLDSRWESVGPSAANRYELRVSAGAVQVSLDEGAPAAPLLSPLPAALPSGALGEESIAIDLLLDGIERRVG
ncbi:MAG: TetR family transcriptional regulator [Candidatus Limnocylindrales bacterium]|jgi:AcrR family transcriptional regulator